MSFLNVLGTMFRSALRTNTPAVLTLMLIFWVGIILCTFVRSLRFAYGTAYGVNVPPGTTSAFTTLRARDCFAYARRMTRAVSFWSLVLIFLISVFLMII